MSATVGSHAPDFTLPNQDRQPVTLSAAAGKNVVLAFFPAAFTSVCQKELCYFRDQLASLNSANATVLGISVDTPFTLKEFSKQNELTFELCRALMAKGGWLALFPEGTSHSETTLLPLKTGAARIALQSEAANDFRLGVTIVPMGLTYEDKETFRSGVTAAIGTPFSLTAYESTFRADEVAAAKALTDDIAARLREVVLEADDVALWRGFRFVAR